MTTIREIFPSNFLGGDDIVGKGDITVTIEKAYQDDVYDPKSKEKDPEARKKRVFIIKFSDARKEMICNKTNARRIAKLHGQKVENWAGKPITLYTERVFAFGDWHNALRVRAGKGGGA